MDASYQHEPGSKQLGRAMRRSNCSVQAVVQFKSDHTGITCFQGTSTKAQHRAILTLGCFHLLLGKCLLMTRL